MTRSDVLHGFLSLVIAYEGSGGGGSAFFG